MSKMGWINPVGTILDLRFFGLEGRCVVRASGNPRYVTLSYVWGQKPFFHMMTKNLLDLEKPGALGQRDIWADGVAQGEPGAMQARLLTNMRGKRYLGTRVEHRKDRDTDDDEWRYRVMLLEPKGEYYKRVAIGSIGRGDKQDSFGEGSCWKEFILR
ncbi:hypothetical protein F4810DRAFT_52778 [Camillea tinctor]|nr:hypothetical protein F4810DRAFT_52778 [Camillea tinctor]